MSSSVHYEVESRFQPRGETKGVTGSWRPYIPFERHLQREFRTEVDARDAVARLTRARVNTEFRVVRITREPIEPAVVSAPSARARILATSTSGPRNINVGPVP